MVVDSLIPATQEADAEKLLEPGRQRLQWAKIMPLHSSLGDRVRPIAKKIFLNKFYFSTPIINNPKRKQFHLQKYHKE